LRAEKIAKFLKLTFANVREIEKDFGKRIREWPLLAFFAGTNFRDFTENSRKVKVICWMISYI